MVMPDEAASFSTRPPAGIFGQYPGHGFAGLGVSTAIGSFTNTALDLGFPGSLPGLPDWQRTYNSHSGAIGALGPGWTTSFTATLVVTPAQGVSQPGAERGRQFRADLQCACARPEQNGSHWYGLD